MTVADLPTICAAPRRAGTIVAVDSTFATPLNQKPLDYGADVVMHSATKFIGGHSDLLAGALIVRDEELYEELCDRRLRYGASIGAMEAFLTIRGARTMALRLDRSQSNAMELAQRLESHREITQVRYPGLASHPTHAVAKSFMTGFGAVLSFETTGDSAKATRVCERAELINYATSLGGVESTMERRAATHGQERIPPTLIRLSVGCENVEDLWSDLGEALV
jgi:cystathionine gamma-synthase